MKAKTSLKPYNSFGIEVFANEILRIQKQVELENWYRQNPNEKFLILGEGSNVLFINDFNGTVLLNEITGKRILKKEQNKIYVHIKGGEKWHDIVMWAVDNNLGGIENLALIPGKVGTAPIQNIGAYGKEFKDVVDKVYAYDFKTQKYISFSNQECKFGYRDSIFKRAENKNRYFITAVDLILSTKDHQINISYGAIQNLLKTKQIDKPTLKDIAEAVIHIRKSKLPDPKELGNAGSFFKNPIIAPSLFENLIRRFPKMPYYLLENQQIKIPAGWLIEQAGFKGKRFGSVGVHDKQALVLVNYGEAKGKDVKILAETIIQKVDELFDIKLHPEVNFIE